ncbi:hypothetical protein QFZ77_000050 [Paenibacillus sp. V4I3]|uniref:DUF2961 domain-containing protein n=1 Tax=Paenibacillus sp. V4I3 TaxID=3042305 RepID=UPI00278B72D0|nr:DUF2961 domain-containing protein [Paenibacillus sp. V4I3]MDQ0871391.1 hypothetical protein [Paenibacillus sp. V4I3]
MATKQPLGGLPFIKDARRLRESSWDRTGGNRDFKVVEPGETCIIADIKGAGRIKHIWLTTRCYAPQYLRKLIIEMYWDGEDNPSGRVPLGDFFGIGHATCKQYVSLPLSMVMGEKRGPKGPFAAAMNSYFPMPFGNGAVLSRKARVFNGMLIPNDLYFIEGVSLHESAREIMVWYTCWLYGFVDGFGRLFK